MIAITLTEFKRNYKTYLEKADVERVILTNKGKTYELLSQGRIIDDDAYFANTNVIERQRLAEEEEKAGLGRMISSDDFRRMAGLR
jgi:hypothetical protein